MILRITRSCSFFLLKFPSPPRSSTSVAPFLLILSWPDASNCELAGDKPCLSLGELLTRAVWNLPSTATAAGAGKCQPPTPRCPGPASFPMWTPDLRSVARAKPYSLKVRSSISSIPPVIAKLFSAL